MATLKRIHNVLRTKPTEAVHASQIFTARAALLVGNVLPAADVSWSAISKQAWAKFREGGQPLNLAATVELLKATIPGIEKKAQAFADRLCHLEPKVLETDKVVIELVTVHELPDAPGAARRWNRDPLTAFLDLLTTEDDSAANCKGVFIENLSAATENGAPLLVGVVQRGDNDWIGDLANPDMGGIDFSGYRTDATKGLQTHAEVVEALRSGKGASQLVFNTPIDAKLVEATQPNQSLYDFGSVIRLTAMDAYGNIIGVATVKPTNIARHRFERRGQLLSMNITQGVDTVGPKIANDRISLPTTLTVPKGDEVAALRLGAEVPADFVRMHAKIGAQTITEPGAGVVLSVSDNQVVASASIPFSTSANIPANEEVEELYIDNQVVGKTLAEMMEQPASVRADSSDVLGNIKADGTPIDGTVSDYAMPERSKIAIAGETLAQETYDNTGIALAPPDGSLQDYLKGHGIEVATHSVKGTSDQIFKVTIDPNKIAGDVPMAIDVGYYVDGKFVWSHAKKGRSTDEADIRTLGKGKETFSVLVPDSVLKHDEPAVPAPLMIRVFRPDDRMPLYLGAYQFEMKQIGLTKTTQLSESENLALQKTAAETEFARSLAAAQADADVVMAEPISVTEMKDRHGRGEEWTFRFMGREFSVRKDPTEATQNAVILENGAVIDPSDGAVRFSPADDLVPNGHFVVSLTAITGQQEALYISGAEIRRAAYPLPIVEGGEETTPRKLRFEELMRQEGEAPVYPNVVWTGADIQNKRIRNDGELQELLGDLEKRRQAAWKQEAKTRRCRDGECATQT